MDSLTLAVSVDLFLFVDCSDCLKDCDERSDEVTFPFSSLINDATEVTSKNKSTDKAMILITK